MQSTDARRGSPEAVASMFQQIPGGVISGIVGSGDRYATSTGMSNACSEVSEVERRPYSTEEKAKGL